MSDKFSKILTIKSDKTELFKVERFLSDLFSEYRLPKGNFNRSYLCISEAVLNAIEHGNGNDSNKNVLIRLGYAKGKIYIEIIDEGDGFNYKDLEDPTVRNNIKKESGRGIHIIKSLSDSIVYNKKGNSVLLKIECK